VRQHARVLLETSLDSLVLAIQHFNRPWDRGRKEAVLILIDRAFELLLKSAILHKGGQNMSQQLADNQTKMTEDQVKRLVKNLANVRPADPLAQGEFQRDSCSRRAFPGGGR